MKRLLLIFAIIPVQLFAANEPINEEDLFSGSDTVIENRLQDNSLNDGMDKRSLSVSGEITSAVSYTGYDDSELSRMLERNPLRPYIVGDLYLDARLPGGYKGFGSFEVMHDTSVDEEKSGEKPSTYSVKELFVDFNINRYIYFRTGKQVLQWGQCYLWNPTDMINIENKSFLSRLEDREGTYGVKGHIPFGTAVNIYGFADMNRASELEDIAGAGKFEFLIKDTEMAFSIWGKKGFHPVYGYDVSARILGIDIKGEASYSAKSNEVKIDDKSGVLTAEKNQSHIYKAGLNIGRSFDFAEKKDRITVNAEMFYNGSGYSDNPVKDKNIYLYKEPLEFEKDGVTYTIPRGDKKTYLAGKKLYEPNYFSRYYAAMFITVRDFIISDITLSFNGIANIQQKSFIVSSGLSYTTINDFTVSATVNGYAGDKDGEYRALTGMKYSAQFTAGILF